MNCLRENRTLLDGFRDGKESALRTIYEKYIKDVELFVSTGWFDPKTRSRTAKFDRFDLRTEMIQEIFLKAFSEKARVSYDGVRPYKVFLLSIARNIIIDHLRKNAKDAISHVCLELDDRDLASDRMDNLDQFIVESEISEETIHWKRCVDATAEYVTTLDSTRQRFVQLRFKEEVPLLEVARRLNLTRGKARALEKQLARQLKDHLSRKNLMVDEFFK